jgi:hypothetical protein
LGATAADAKDPLTRLPRSNFAANLIHFAGEFYSGDISWGARRRGIIPFALQNVCPIQCRRAHANAHTIRAGSRWSFNFPNL